MKLNKSKIESSRLSLFLLKITELLPQSKQEIPNQFCPQFISASVSPSVKRSLTCHSMGLQDHRSTLASNEAHLGQPGQNPGTLLPNPNIIPGLQG